MKLGASFLAMGVGGAVVGASSDLCSLPNNDFVCYKLHPSFLSDLEPDWPSGMPKDAGSLSAVGVDPTVGHGGAEIYVSQRGPADRFATAGPILVFNENGDLVRQFGGAGDGSIGRNDTKKMCPKNFQTCTPDKTYGGHGLSVKPDPGEGATQIWVDDFFDFDVKVFNPEGLLLGTSGQPGHTGSGIQPVQYNTVADTAFGKGKMVYISDGDGSSNHRVVALNVTSLESPALNNPVWVMGNNHTKSAGGVEEMGHDITSAHSIAYHSHSDTLLLADRENNRTLHISASTGAVLANWSCPELQLGKKGTVYAVRVSESLNLVFLVVADKNKANVAAGKPNQFLYVLDGSSITDKGPGQCKIVQTLKIDPKKCMTPHLMGHNEYNHDLYVACVGKPTAVLRFVRERVLNEIVDDVGAITATIVVAAIVVGLVWWFVAKRVKLRQKTELSDPIAQW